LSAAANIMSDNKTRSDQERTEFARQAEAAESGVIREFVLFLRHTRKWWLTPILVLLLLAGLIVVLGGSAAAPFIYTLF
jgi:hypothetical protein